MLAPLISLWLAAWPSPGAPLEVVPQPGNFWRLIDAETR